MFGKKKNIVKTYQGRQEAAQRAFLKDAAKMAKKGYFPADDRWEDGKWGTGQFILALLLCLILIGIIIFIYMLLVKPPGKLTVTYNHRSAQEIASLAEKTCPQCAETIKEAAIVCRYCDYKFA